MDRLLSGLLLPALPAWALVTALHPKLRGEIAGRWGLARPPVQPGSVWLHAASVGEVRAAGRLLPLLPAPVLFTADTDAGVAEARQQVARDGRPGVVAGVRPVDHGFVLAPLWAEARPRAVLFVEGTFWPSLAWRASRAGVPVLRVGAKAGRGTRRLGPTGLLRRWWRPTTAVLARDDAAARWFARVQDAPVQVVGNPKALSTPQGRLAVRFPGPFMVGASTRAGDEARLLDAIGHLPSATAVLIAPRQLDRVSAVHRLCRARNLSTVLRSALTGDVPAGTDVVILDTMELDQCLAGASAALIGGTFDAAVGGHSPWEAAAAGVQVVAGPYGHAQGDAFEEVDAVRVASDDPATLAEALLEAARRGPAHRGAAPADPDRQRWREALARHLGPPGAEASPRPWLAPVATVVSLASRLHLASWGLRRTAVLPVPVISVGSINARSPGRTSTARALVGALAARGHRVGVALRGHHRRGSGLGWSVRDPGVHALGDEGALLAEAGALVAAHPDRVRAARALVDAGVTVIVLDDGLQHRRLHRDLEIVVVDARFPCARGPLPAGEAREPGPAPARADFVLVHHGSAEFSTPGHPAMRRPGPWCTVRGPSEPPPQPVFAFCGIGRPADFLASLDVAVAGFRALADHQAITPSLARALQREAAGRTLVCTGKDAVRLPPDLRRHVWWRDVDVLLPEALLLRVEALR